MQRYFLILFLYLAFNAPSSVLSSSTFTKDCSKESKKFLVNKVFDGDTILVNSGQRPENRKKVRLLGIDAFEHDQISYGLKAEKFLSKLLLNKNVCIETDVQEKDIYGRTLGYVFLNSNVFVNTELLKNGYAIIYDFPPNIKYIDRLESAQIYARKNMLGIWEKENYIKETPSQWRHKHPYKKNNTRKRKV